MKQVKILLLGLLLGTTPCIAGTLTLTATAPGVNLSQSVTIPDADIPRVLAWAKSQYGTSANAATFTAIAQDIFAVLKQNVLNYERAAASKTATDAVQPVTMQ